MQNRRILACVLSFVVLGVISCLTGCAARDKNSTGHTLRAERGQDDPRERTQLSYGTVTSRVQKGVTTQAEILDLFGGPNITTFDSEGDESWVYEVASSSSTVSASDASAVRAENFVVFFGIGVAGRGNAEVNRTHATRTEHSIRTLTVIIKFNADKTVKEYSARASYF